MYSEITDYKAPAEFAKTFVRKNGKVGVGRAYINQLIDKEKASPGSTDLDVLSIDGKYFVRSRK